MGRSASHDVRRGISGSALPDTLTRASQPSHTLHTHTRCTYTYYIDYLIVSVVDLSWSIYPGPAKWHREGGYDAMASVLARGSIYP